MASAPTIPQRPAGRSQQNNNLPAPTANMDIPQVPARPRREVARSISPNRDSFARSPLNDPSFIHKPPPHGTSRLQKMTSRDGPLRPPSVDFPSIGGEGNEYAQFEHSTSPDQPKSVTHDLPLHAPKASLPASQAQARIATVTRTDSNQAAAAGIGKPSHFEDSAFGTGLFRTTSAQRSRPPSLYSKDEPDHGIPQIGSHIPLFPGAGDVQAPTPTPSESGSRRHLQPSSTTDTAAASGRHHSRTKSGREVFHGPPGSYGLHGHGVKPKDALEKAWYSKHPDELKREGKGEYGPAISVDRKEYTMSSEDLNRLVHSSLTESMGSSSRVIGTPDEQIGYLASEAYSSRLTSPKPKDGRRSSSQLHAESPLRKSTFADSEIDPHALESDAEHDEPINIQPPSRRGSAIPMGLNPALAEEHGNQTGAREDENGYTAPILAADELRYRPEAQYMQAAVEPGSESDVPRKSRPSSRAGSVNLNRVPTREETGTPLDDVKEYEPLFPEDGDDDATRKAKFDALKHKRPDLARHHFPSSDVWEDTPNSLMYETTVDTPQEAMPRRAGRSNLAAEHEPSEYFETPEAEQARKDNITAADQQNFLPEKTKKLARTHLNADVLADMPTRPGMRHRFPSQDVWEDTPDSALHTTEITPEPEEEEQKAALPVPKGLAKSQETASSPLAGPVATADEVEPIERRAMPDRSKPQVPARPATREAGGEPLALTKSKSQEKEGPPVKSKPAVPARPVGGKIAALQAGFMNDLNNRLKLGPQAPPSRKEEVAAAGGEEEEEAEKAPLADARKGRAKGPSRRKPGVSPSSGISGGADNSKPPQVRFSMMSCWTVWEIDEDQLSVPKSVVPVSNISSQIDSDAKPVIRGPPAELASQVDAEPADIQAIKASADMAGEDVGQDEGQTHASVQTGQKDLSINHKGEQSDITAYVGGRAHPPGDVIVEHREGKEHVSATEPEE